MATATTWAPAFEEMHLLDPVPQVVSVSSAYGESFYQGEAGGPSYECEDEVALCTLAARGASIIAGSGDFGAAGIPSCGLTASWPCSSPVVTCVGGTMFDGTTVNSTQRVCQAGDLPATLPVTPAGITGGGGFSSLWERPAYQYDAVEAWWNANQGAYAGYNTSRPVDPNHGTFRGPNTQGFWLQGRAVPDVAAPAHSFPVVSLNSTDGWTVMFSDGTSASTPVVASLVALLADAVWQHSAEHKDRSAENMSPAYLGCINPLLYAAAPSAGVGTPSYVDDVEQGNNFCPSTVQCCNLGFNATAGWDPTTGFGVPMYDAMLAAFLQTP